MKKNKLTQDEKMEIKKSIKAFNEMVKKFKNALINN